MTNPLAADKMLPVSKNILKIIRPTPLSIGEI
jgi:hypothetical protein